MRKFKHPKIIILFAISALALTVSSCVESAAVLQPDPESASHASTHTISPKYASLSNPAVTTNRTAKEYYLDLERCRGDAFATLGGTGSDDVSALRRALQNQSDASSVVVHYDTTDRAIVRDRAVKTCLAKKGYAVKL